MSILFSTSTVKPLSTSRPFNEGSNSSATEALLQRSVPILRPLSEAWAKTPPTAWTWPGKKRVWHFKVQDVAKTSMWKATSSRVSTKDWPILLVKSSKRLRPFPTKNKRCQQNPPNQKTSHSTRKASSSPLRISPATSSVALTDTCGGQGSAVATNSTEATAQDAPCMAGA